MKVAQSKISKNRKNQKGVSLFETIPLIMVMAALVAFVLGFWGMTHKNILYSIAARNYAFETFNNRSNLVYFNDNRVIKHSYEQSQMRFHGAGAAEGESSFTAFTVPFKFGGGAVVQTGADEVHMDQIWNPSVLQTGKELRPDIAANMTHAWILVGYGICLNASCGDE